MKIYKYQLPAEPVGKTNLLLPKGFRPLKLGWQRDRTQFQKTHLCLWAAVNSNATVSDVSFFICTTGDKIPQSENSRWKYLDTVMNNDGQYILHVFYER